MTSGLVSAAPWALRMLVRLSTNSRLAISAMKCDPPFFAHVSVRCRAASCTLGFLWPIRRFRLRIASRGCTVLLRITSLISRLRAISSRDEEVARSIWASSSALPAPPNHEAMVDVVDVVMCGGDWELLPIACVMSRVFSEIR